MSEPTVGTVGGYPVTLRLDGRRCLVVGGGAVAVGKVQGLLAAGANVTVVAVDVVPELDALPVAVARRAYRRADLDGCWLVIAATGDPTVNAAVHADGEAAGIWVNAADDPANCSFTLPAIARRGPIAVAVSTGGSSPALATWLRRRIEADLGPEHEVLAQLLADERQALRSAAVPTEGLPWQAALDAGLLDLIREGRVEDARALLRETVREAVVERTSWQ